MCERSRTTLRLLSSLVAVAIATSALAGDCPGDLDGSGDVDGGDLAILLGAWGPCDDPDNCPADLDASGNVDGADLAILLGAWGECPGPFEACGQSGAGDCFVDNGTPGCDWMSCCEEVCAADPFCCDVAWDAICATAANEICCPLALCSPAFCGPGTGDCCTANGTPGCDDFECCETVCACDPFCCDIEWDSICAGEGIDGCGAMFLCKELCGGDPNFPCWPGAGDCCTANGTIGCQGEECCWAVCAQDPFCCEAKWDQICADIANDLCSVCQ